MKFQEDFEGLAKFNPMSRCITIASACNVLHLNPFAVCMVKEDPILGEVALERTLSETK